MKNIGFTAAIMAFTICNTHSEMPSLYSANWKNGGKFDSNEIKRCRKRKKIKKRR